MRGGSKGIPRKNVVPFEGRPLCHHVLQAATESSVARDDIWVSTDDLEIKTESLKFGVHVIDRPSELAQDLSTDLDVFKHFVDTVVDKQERGYDYIIHLRSTYPRMTPQIIEKATQHFEKHYDGCTSMRSVVKAKEIPYKMWEVTDSHGGCDTLSPVGGIHQVSLPRQLLPQAYYQNAAIDLVKCDTIRKYNSMIGYHIIAFHMDGMVEDGVDIDNPEDLR